ncbi:MAG: hypothetical protein AAB654_16645, partial [Acidobacteriota bacterium]
MSSQDSIAELRNRLAALEQEAQSVSALSREAVANLGAGLPVDETLIRDVQRISRSVIDFRLELKTFGTENSLIPEEVNLDSARFSDFADLLRQFESLSTNRLQSLSSKLRALEDLVLTNESFRPVLQVVFDEAAHLRKLLDDSVPPALPRELLEFAVGRHRLAKLLRYLEIQQTGDVGTDEFDVLDSEIESAFGRPFRARASALRFRTDGGPAPARVGEAAPTGPGFRAVPTPDTAVAVPQQPPEVSVGAAAAAVPAKEEAEPGPAAAQPTPEPPDDVDRYAEQLVAEAEAEISSDLGLAEPAPPSIRIEQGPSQLSQPVLAKNRALVVQRAGSLLSDIDTRGIEGVDCRGLEALAVQLLEDERPALAWVLWSALRPAALPFHDALPPQALRAAALAGRMYRPDGEAAEILAADCKEILAAWRTEGDIPPHFSYWFLAITSKPALFAAEPVARDMLWALANSRQAAQPLRNIARLFAEFSSKDWRLDAVQIRGTIHVGTRAAVLADLKEKAGALLTRSGRAARVSGSAIHIWKYLTRPDGVVRRLLEPVQESRTGDLNAIRAAIREVRTLAAVRHEVELAEIRSTQGARAVRRGSPDWDDLLRDIQDARDIASQWLALMLEPRDTPEDPAANLRTGFESARKELDAHLAELIQKLQSFEQIPIRAGLQACAEMLDSIDKVLRGEIEGWPPYDAVAGWIASDLHLVPGADPTAWKRSCEPEEALRLLRFLASDSTWADCARQLVAEARFASVEAMIQRLREPAPEAATFLQAYSSESLLYSWRQLGWCVRSTLHQLEIAMNNALVCVDDAQNFRAQVDEIKVFIPEEFLAAPSAAWDSGRPVPLPPSPAFFASAGSTLDEIERFLADNLSHFISEGGRSVVLPGHASPRVRAAFDRLVGLGAFNRALILSELAAAGS